MFAFSNQVVPPVKYHLNITPYWRPAYYSRSDACLCKTDLDPLWELPRGRTALFNYWVPSDDADLGQLWFRTSQMTWKAWNSPFRVWRVWPICEKLAFVSGVWKWSGGFSIVICCPPLFSLRCCDIPLNCFISASPSFLNSWAETSVTVLGF